MSVPFHYLDLRTFCYGTESEDRVESALRTLLPEDVPIERMESEGHHGDTIVVLSARVERADEIRDVLDALGEAGVLDEVSAELDDRLDDNNSLFVHLDKQAAAQGELALGAGIALRGKVEAYPATRDAALENVREAL
ncbi:MAG: RNA-binding protein [Halobacteriota archaeon]